MAVFDTKQQGAAFVILALGAGLALSLLPYFTGIIGIPVLFVLFYPLHNWLVRSGAPVGLSAIAVTLLGATLVIVPGVALAGLLVNEAQDIGKGVVNSRALQRLQEFRIAGFDVGPRVADAAGAVVGWLGSSAFGLLGTATRLGLNLTISFFGLYYVLKTPGDAWATARPYIPFSSTNAAKLKKRFRDVTISTVIGTGFTAAVQATLLGAAFAVLGIPNALFWSVVTFAVAILPVVGSGLVWGPAAIGLALQDRIAAAVILLVWGVVVVGSSDNLIRPLIYRRFAQIHPMVTLIGAIAGVSKFGLLGLLIGPLALSYFFELVRMYREEYLEPESVDNPA
jgi:predicted PurR-regulated permease PerM